MRRLKVFGRTAVYHCISRVVGNQWLLGDEEKEVFRKQMWQVADFCGVEVMTYCIMDNHFHILVRVPTAPSDGILDSELVRRYSVLYPEPTPHQPMPVDELEASLKSRSPDAERIREELLSKMHDVSMFMKMLKQRFTIWYNRTHNRFGTLWSDRFKSLLLENTKAAKMIVAAYIDLNPIRAGIVEDPKDYRFSGYGESTRNTNSIAQHGLMLLMESKDLNYVYKNYRELLYLKGAAPDKTKSKQGYLIPQKAVNSALEERNKIDGSLFLRKKNRYLADGLILGNSHFVEEVFHENREHFGPQRRSGARSMKGNPLKGLFVARDLQKNIYGCSKPASAIRN